MSWVRSRPSLLFSIRKAALWIGAQLALLGCASGVKVNGVVGYSKDGLRVIAADRAGLQVFDLPTKTALWQVGGVPPAGWRASHAIPSPTGAYFVLAEQEYPASTDGHYSVWESASGRRVSPVLAISGAGVSTPGGLAVSDDGRWLVSNRDGAHLRVLETRSGKSVLELEHHGQERLPIAFSPSSQRLATAEALFELRDEQWRPVTRLVGAEDFVWLGEQLAVASLRGLDILDGERVLQHVDLSGEVRLTAGRGVLAIVERRDLDPRVTVYDVEAKRERFARRGLGDEVNVTFRDDALFVLAVRDDFDTYVLRLDEQTGAVKHELSLGAWASGGVRASPKSVNFLARLLPGAHYVALMQRDLAWGRFRRIDF
jgi:hypothetical protein